MIFRAVPKADGPGARLPASLRRCYASLPSVPGVEAPGSMPARTIRLCVVFLLASGAGCAGRSEFHRAEALAERGDYRQAYYHYWEAHRLNPRQDYRAALRDAGRHVAEDLYREGREAERRLDYEKALEAYALGLEYAPASAALLEGHARAREQLLQWEAWTRELDACRSSGAPGWMEVDLLLEMALHPSFSGVHWQEIQEALDAASLRASRPLRVATFESELPGDRRALEELARRWSRLGEECRHRIREEELWSQAPEHRESEAKRVWIARMGTVRGILQPVVEESRAAERLLARALAGVDKLEQAAALEMARRLDASFQAYSRAALLHPDLEEARAGRARTLRLLAAERHRAALLAVERRDWNGALSQLDELLDLVPSLESALELRAVVRRELADQHSTRARRFEQAGLQGNALVHYRLALRFTAGEGTEELHRAITRNERSIRSRLCPDIHLRVRSVSPGERGNRRALWKVDELTHDHVERELIDAARRRLEDLRAEGRDVRTGPDDASRTLTVLVEDLEFVRLRGKRSSGREEIRCVEQVSRVPNPEYESAIQRRDAAREAYRKALGELESLPGGAEPEARARVPFLRVDWEQLETLVSSLPPEIPAVRWGSTVYTRVTTTIHMELAARYRFDGAEHWISSSMEFDDCTVAGDPTRNLLPDPGPALSRSEALRALAPRLGAALGEEVGRLLADRHTRLWHESQQHLSQGSYDLAVEDLVAYLLARRGSGDPHFEEAARTLEQLTGCDLGADEGPSRTRDD